MDTSSTEELRRIWAGAIPLSKFIEDRTGGRAPPAPGLKTRKIRKPSALELIFERNEVQQETIKDLIAGRLVAVGRRSDSYEFDWISASFWIGAVVIADTVSRDGTLLVEVGIAPPEARRDVQQKQKPNPEASARAEVRRAAIMEYLKTDPDLSAPRSKRYRAYKSYISSHGFDTNKRGFSVKTFEKDETEFRPKPK